MLHMASSPTTLDYAAPANKPSEWSRFVHWIVRILLPVSAALLLMACLLFALLLYTYRPRKVATISGPPGTTATYELWYDKAGNLTFLPAGGGWTATQLDYYESRAIASTNWIDSDHLELTTPDGIVFKIQLSARTLTVDYSAATRPSATTQPAGP